MERIGILHLSDIHLCEENEKEIVQLLDKLNCDIDVVCQSEKFKIQAICLTGDLINKGSENASAFASFERAFLMPLLNKFHLDSNSVFIVPGNHEVDISKIDRFTEAGLVSQLTSEETVKDLTRGQSQSALERLSYFKEIQQKYCTAKLVHEDVFCRCYQKSIDRVPFGFACLNSSWRSSGKGSDERGNMILGACQVEQAIHALENAKVKVCLLHHPLDWLTEWDKYDIEKLLCNFDFILNGHIHTLDTKSIIAYHGQSIVSTSGRFYPSEDYYNGYSIIAIDPDTYNGGVFLRQYYPARNCFDKCLNLYSEGTFPFSLSQKDPLTVKAFEIVHDLTRGFHEYSSNFIISNVVTPANQRPFEEVFVAPPLGKWSEYQKETNHEIKDYTALNLSEEYISLDSLTSGEKRNLLFYGKKEYGKTTLIHYFINLYLRDYRKRPFVPFYIDCNSEFNGKRSIEKKCCTFFSEFSTGSVPISLDDISALATQGRLALFFDNFESATHHTLSKFKAFIDKYPNNQYMFFALETITTESIDQSAEMLCPEIDRIYIHSLGKHEIRNLANNMLTSAFPATNNIVDKTVLCIRNINLPTTPFVVSLVLSICKENEDFIPINEANVIEAFLETLLEKNSKDSAKTDVYDYKIQEDFLCYLIAKMREKNQYWFSQQEFETHLQTYHSNLGWTIRDTHFDTLFFKKGILYNIGDRVAFRYSCVVYYYTAKLALKSAEFIDEILEDDNYLMYPYELNYITGIDRGRKDIYEKINKEYESLCEEYRPHLEVLNHYGIQTDFSVKTDNLKNALPKKLSIEDSDRLTGNHQAPHVEDSVKLEKAANHLESVDAKAKFLPTLSIYAMLLKNCELYDVSIKEKMLHNFAEGLCIALAMLIESFNNNRPALLQHIQEVCTDNPQEEMPSPEQIARFTEDTIKIVLPIVIENIAFEQAGSAKLKSLILPMVQDCRVKGGFSQFLMLFLYCDLRISGCLNELSSFVKRTNSKDILTITLFKTLYYYQVQYFPEQMNTVLEGIIADINMKLQDFDQRTKGIVKSRIIKELRSKRKIRPKVEM